MEASQFSLEVKDLTASFETESGRFAALDKVSFGVPKGKTLGVVGESGCGKSVTSLCIMGLLPRPSGVIESGQILFERESGQVDDLTKISVDDYYRVRGREIAMIFQEPMTALNPVKRISSQIKEVFELHFPTMSETDMLMDSVRLLEKVGIPAPSKRIHDYPHQLSGGMRQRVMIAMALAGQPKLLVADEPTTALDVTTQSQILYLFKQLQEELGMSLMLITHDMGVVAQVCDDVAVMYAGRVIEQGPIIDLFKNSRHPYTHGLLKAIPSVAVKPKSELYSIDGLVPSLQRMPEYCRFANRCEFANAECMEKRPTLAKVGIEHFSACIRVDEIFND